MRSGWKKPINRNYFTSSVYFSKSYFFQKRDLDQRLQMHTGKKFFFFPVRAAMLNHFAGEFFFSKKTGRRIHLEKKKKLHGKKNLNGTIHKQ